MLQQRWEAIICQKESLPQWGLKITTTRSWIPHAHHWATWMGLIITHCPKSTLTLSQTSPWFLCICCTSLVKTLWERAISPFPKVPSSMVQSIALQTWEQEVTGSILGLANILSKDWWWSLWQDSFLSHCCPSFFDNGYLGKQPLAWEEYCAEYWLKVFQESMDRCTVHCDINEILLKTAFNTIQSINLFWKCFLPFWRNSHCLNQFNPFRNKPWFFHVCTNSLLKTLQERRNCS